MAEHSWIDEHIELYAVGALDDTEIDRIEVEIARETVAEQRRYRHEVSRTREALAKMTIEVATPPPPRIREQLLASLSSQPLDPPDFDRSTDGVDPGKAVSASNNVIDLAARRRRISLAVGSVAAALMLVIGGVLVGRVTAPDTGAPVASELEQDTSKVLSAPDMQLRQDAVGGGNVTVAASREANTAVVFADGLPPTPTGQTYQMWLLGDSHDPTSVGLMQGDPGRQVIALDDLTGSDKLGITIEPDGGSPQPTGEVITAVQF
ncbi:anti-sigma factor [Williamsia soli]|uniref:anti-sigma factor n=1 Tax=Williamsia soli TaxID=364929 RepID=UPI001A9E0679|nr:anti-sigma factor [Williamsia soli]